MTSLPPLNFDDLTPIEESFKFRGKKYWITEASESAGVKYRNAAMKAAKWDDGKVVGIEGAADVELLLVSLCLFVADKDGNLQRDSQGNPDMRALVPLASLRNWPNRVIKPIFDRVKKISELDDQEKTEEELEKEIGELKKKLAALRKARGEKNGQEQGTDAGGAGGEEADGTNDIPSQDKEGNEPGRMTVTSG